MHRRIRRRRAKLGLGDWRGYQLEIRRLNPAQSEFNGQQVSRQLPLKRGSGERLAHNVAAQSSDQLVYVRVERMKSWISCGVQPHWRRIWRTVSSSSSSLLGTAASWRGLGLRQNCI